MHDDLHTTYQYNAAFLQRVHDLKCTVHVHLFFYKQHHYIINALINFYQHPCIIFKHCQLTPYLT